MNINKALIKTAAIQSGIACDPKNIAVFGAGKNGLFLKHYINKNDFNVNYFCDNDLEKQGTLIDGVQCISLDDLIQKKDEMLVFVSPDNSAGIFNELKTRKFPYVVSSEYIKYFRFFDAAEVFLGQENFQPLGHYYSLYPDMKDIMDRSEKIFEQNKQILDIDFRKNNQISILKEMTELYSSIPQWPDMTAESGTSSSRYRYGNPSLSPADTIGLHCMLRIIKPKNMIEVGSGYTSAVTLDTNENYFNNKINLTFIEPYPELLKSLLKNTDQINLMKSNLQDIPLETFDRLNSGDILFIDSTHVSKIGSDVNYLFFEILPRLKRGIYISMVYFSLSNILKSGLTAA